jgi:hypothetical protein
MSALAAQRQRQAEGFVVVEWEYPDGSGSWGYCERGEEGAIAQGKPGCRVWTNGVHQGVMGVPDDPDERGAWRCTLCGFRGFWEGGPHCLFRGIAA